MAKLAMGPLPTARLAHVGIHVRDLDRMIEFYRQAFGMVVSDSGDYYMGGRIAFLSADPQEHHQLVLASGRADDGSLRLINQISFRVASLEDLKTYFDRLSAMDVDEINPRNHGNAWSIYFRDPEGNRIEVYTPTPWYVAQPFGQPLDLAAPADTIRAATHALVKDDATVRPAQEWQSDMAQKIEMATGQPPISD